MALRSLNVLIILFLLNASATALVASGLADDLGINPYPGGDDELDSANKSAQNISTGSGTGGTLFAMLTAGAKTVKAMVTTLFIAPIMFNNLGVPAFITTFVFAPMYIIVGIDVLQILTGRIAA